MVKTWGQYVALRRAKPEELAKYPRTDWKQLLVHLEAKHGGDRV